MPDFQNNNRLRKVMADSSQKRCIMGVLIATLILLILSYILAVFAVPSAYLKVLASPVCPENMKTYNSFCNYLNLSNGGYWRGFMTHLNKTNVYIMISGQFHVNQNNTSDFGFGVRFSSNITAVGLDTKAIKNEDNEYFSVLSNDTMNVNCPAKSAYCDSNVLLLYPQLDFDNYLLEIDIFIDPAFTNLIDGIVFDGKTQNSEFTNYLIIFRYLWFGISILALMVYSCFYCKSTKSNLTFEHHFIMILSVSLVFFNDPFFAATLFKPSVTLAVLSTIFVVQFVSLLVFFWVVMWRRMHLEPVSQTTNQSGVLPISISLLFFILLAVAGCLASVYSRFEPGVHANTS